MKKTVSNHKPIVAKLADKPLPSDPKLIWEGRMGLVELKGMKFLVSMEKKDEHEFSVVRLYFAPQGTELADLSGADMYVTIGKLRKHKFLSPFKERSGLFEKQKRIWDFLRGEFAKAGITEGAAKAKSVPVAQPAKPEVTKSEDAYKGSTDIGRLVSGFYGDYVLGKPGARALIRVRNHENGVKKQYTVAEFVRCEAKNPLRRTKFLTYIPHSWLSKYLSEIEIRGARAVDMTELHLYLTTIIDAHRGEVYASMGARTTQVNLSAEPPREGEPLH